MNIQPLVQTDYYKVHHYLQYPEGTTKIYSNLTPRKSRIKGVNAIVVFGIQYFILEYLIKQWNENFFFTRFRKGGEYEDNFLEFSKGDYPKLRDDVIGKYKRMMDATCGKDVVSMKHIEDLWDLGYMPLEIKALPEGEQNALSLKSFNCWEA